MRGAVDPAPHGEYEFTTPLPYNADGATVEGRPWPIAQLPTTVMVGRDGRPLGKWEGILPPRETEELVRSLVLDSGGR